MGLLAEEWELEIHHIDLGEGRPAPGDATLLLVKKDGNFLDPPYSVPIRIGAAP